MVGLVYIHIQIEKDEDDYSEAELYIFNRMGYQEIKRRRGNFQSRFIRELILN